LFREYDLPSIISSMTAPLAGSGRNGKHERPSTAAATSTVADDDDEEVAVAAHRARGLLRTAE
jgi:hypothetical protein